jgi:hypothetical protein
VLLFSGFECGGQPKLEYQRRIADLPAALPSAAEFYMVKAISQSQKNTRRHKSDKGRLQ